MLMEVRDSLADQRLANRGAVLPCAVSQWRSGRRRPRVLLLSRPLLQSASNGRGVCNEDEVGDFIRCEQ